MQPKEFQLNESASFIFQYTNAVYKVTLNIESVIVILEELHKYQKKRDIKQIITIPIKETGTNIVTEENKDNLVEEPKE